MLVLLSLSECLLITVIVDQLIDHLSETFDNSFKCVIFLNDCFEDLWCQSFAGVFQPEELCRTKCPVSSILGTFVPCMQRAPPVDLSAL